MSSSIHFKKRKVLKYIQHILTLLITVMLLYVFWYQYDSRQIENKNKKLSEMVLQSEEKFPAESEENGAEGMLQIYEDLFAVNNEMKGWIAIEGTELSLPVVQGNDNEFYLEHDFFKEKDRHGSIFADCDTDLGTPQANIFLYGHHMKDNSMFGILEEYENPSFLEKHRMIQFNSLNEMRTYEVMAVFKTRIFFQNENVFRYYNYKNISAEENFKVFCENILDLSLVDTGVSASFGDELLTLSTCDYSVEDGRFVVVAKRIKE